MSVVWVALKKTQFNKLNVANIWLDIANVYGSIRRRLIGALKKAPCNKLNVANLWLDTANVCGSIQHRLIFFTLKKYGAHEHQIFLIKAHYLEFAVNLILCSALVSENQHLRGIFVSYALSIILFLPGIDVIIEYAILPKEPVIIEYAILSKEPCLIYSGKVYQPLVRAFMDDMSLVSSFAAEAKDLVSRCTIALIWVDMSYRAQKSCSTVIHVFFIRKIFIRKRASKT